MSVLWPSSLGHTDFIFFSHSSGKIHMCRILLMFYEYVLKWTVVSQHNFDLWGFLSLRLFYEVKLLLIYEWLN